MISSVLTLFNWSLRMDAKSVFPYILRAVFALMMLFAISASAVNMAGSNSVGLQLFGYICFMNVAVITVAGVSYFVTAVTEEKDAGTYALLRLAGMSPLSITLGKSTSRLVTSLMLLVIQLPFTFLSITLGGVLWSQIIAAYLSLAAWMILIANMSLFCSVRCATSGRAASLASFILLVFFLVPPVVTNGLAALPASAVHPRVEALLEDVVVWTGTVSVVNQLLYLFTLTGPVVFLPAQVWWNILLGLAFFIISTACLDRWSAPSESGVMIEHKKLRRFEVGRCWRLPIAWKEFLYFTGGRSFFVAKFVMGGIVYAGFVAYQSAGSGPYQLRLVGDHGWNALLTFVCCLTAEVLLYASGVLFFEIRQLTQSTLATVPISHVRVLLEKTIGCLIAIIPVVFWIGFTMVFGYQSINRYLSLTMVVSYLVMLGFSSHVAALLSLYTRWAALPLTVLIAIPSFGFLALPILALTQLSANLAAQQGIPTSDLIVIMINVFWTWMFILLPLELWIRDRWISVTRVS